MASLLQLMSGSVSVLSKLLQLLLVAIFPIVGVVVATAVVMLQDETYDLAIRRG